MKTATVTSLKINGMKVLIKHSQENVLVPVTRLCTQRSCRFAKHEKLAILGILAKGGST